MTEEVKDQTAADAAAPAATVENAPLKGLMGTKIGMTRVYLDDGRQVPVTVIASEGAVVSQVKTLERDGYTAVQVGIGEVQEEKLSKAEARHFAKQNLAAKRHLVEFRVKDAAPFKVGQAVPVSVFSKGEWVNVSGLNKGKGYAGTIKRHKFRGLPHSHGNGEYRRSPGSSGAQGPQHVLRVRANPATWAMSGPRCKRFKSSTSTRRKI